MTESTRVTKITRTTVTGGGDHDMDFDDSRISKSVHRYQVYRGMSPSTSSRIEIRIKELEEALDSERDGRMRAERELNDVSIQYESLREKLDEVDGLNASHNEISRKREMELTKARKDMELISIQHESSEASLRKRHQDNINDLSGQVEHLQRAKSKSEKDKQTLVVEIDGISSQLDAALKAKAHAENRADNMEAQLRSLKNQVDELTRQNQDLNGIKARLTQENFELQRQVQDLDSSTGSLSKAKATLQAMLDDMKAKHDDESRQRQQLTIQVNNLSIELDNMNIRFEEETEAASMLRAQNQKISGEFMTLKSKFDKELALRTEELDSLRRKLNARIAELEDQLEQARLRANKFEKDKTKLSVEIREITIELETAHGNVLDLSKRLKSAEGANGELQRRVDEMSHELSVATADNSRMNQELVKLRALCSDLEAKADTLNRENKQLADALREAQSGNKDLNRQVLELTSIRIQLEADRDNMAGELADLRDAFKDAQGRLDAANSALSHMRTEMDQRLREKDDEIDNVRKAGQRALDELQRTLIEIETRYKAEISKLRKKYESEIREFEIQIETVSRTNIELSKSNKAIGARLKELEIIYEEERRSGEEARQAVTMLERKRIALTTELEDVRALLENSERARKNAEGELHDAGSRINELTISITSLTSDKRRMEADIGTMQADLDEAMGARRASDDRADRLGAEVNRLSDELRQEQENYKNAEALRKQLEIEIREITVRLEEAEAFAQREGKRMVVKLQARLRDLEAELEGEQRRAREFSSANRKLERQLNEIRVQADEDHRVVIELREISSTYSNKIKILRRQLEEAEEVVSITMNKYRKAQTMIEEADHRADLAEKTMMAGRTRSRSMSVTREITRVIRA